MPTRKGAGAWRAKAVMLAMALLFTACLFGFSLLANRELALPIQTAGGYPDVQAAAPGDWAANLLSIELPGVVRGTHILTASIDDPDWPMPTPAQQTASGTVLTPIVTAGTGPVIMLYSTHSNESYRKTDATVYKELGNSRTLDANYNILRVNRELSTLLADTYKLPVFFDNTDHELGKYYTTSYERSLSSVQKAKKNHPTLGVFFDIHRDAAGSALVGDTVTVGGKACARVMIVVGTGEGKTGTGFSVKPNFKSNKALADAITAEINKLAPGLCRPVRVKTGRYNQHVSDAALAFEIGHNQNTLEEALNAVPYLAQAINNVLTRDLDIRPVPVP
jgi:stage II sporulation protein P